MNRFAEPTMTNELRAKEEVKIRPVFFFFGKSSLSTRQSPLPLLPVVVNRRSGTVGSTGFGTNSTVES
jgi:hypothetical protein